MCFVDHSIIPLSTVCNNLVNPPAPLCWQLEVTREEEITAEAATIETAWVVEPPLLEHLLDQEISAFISEGVSAFNFTHAERERGGGARDFV